MRRLKNKILVILMTASVMATGSEVAVDGPFIRHGQSIEVELREYFRSKSISFYDENNYEQIQIDLPLMYQYYRLLDDKKISIPSQQTISGDLVEKIKILHLLLSSKIQYWRKTQSEQGANLEVDKCKWSNDIEKLAQQLHLLLIPYEDDHREVTEQVLISLGINERILTVEDNNTIQNTIQNCINKIETKASIINEVTAIINGTVEGRLSAEVDQIVQSIKDATRKEEAKQQQITIAVTRILALEKESDILKNRVGSLRGQYDIVNGDLLGYEQRIEEYTTNVHRLAEALSID
ncbi:MAG: hypothetical protein HQK53_07040, partial [Oligoflexia bacterium]|nr:hypothetical protein [Oligoflexia bacterium]